MKYLKISEGDTVAVALEPIAAGEKIVLANTTITIKEDIEPGHKFAIADIECGSAVIKYGFSIGNATENICSGSHVHVHNLKTALDKEESYSFTPKAYEKKDFQDLPGNCFLGYRRKDGRYGIRNDIWIVPTVGCVNSTARKIREAFLRERTGDNDFSVYVFTHNYGCSQMGDDQENTRHALSALIKHPNAGGVLVVGLGCENSNIDVLKNGIKIQKEKDHKKTGNNTETYLGEYDDSRIRFLQCQDVEDEVSEGVKILEELYEKVKFDKRERADLSKLVVGLKCGGSDGFSGITANPVVGCFSDMLTSAGGSTILTEVPEMFGAERILMERCKDEDTFDKTVRLINDFKEYYRSHGQTIYENPSPGNKKGGISTLEEKALGCTQKSGFSTVEGVLDYCEKISDSGLNLLKAPGNDLVASTALSLSGAQLVLFTTGRGTPFSCPVPTVKISSNTALYEKKGKWIDFDAGRALSGDSLYSLGRELFSLVLDTASGKRVKAEELEADFAIWKDSVTL